MKTKLSITNEEAFRAACDASDIKVIEKREFGNIIQVIVSFRHPEQLYKAGLIENDLIRTMKESNKPLDEPRQNTEPQPAKKLPRKGK